MVLIDTDDIRPNQGGLEDIYSDPGPDIKYREPDQLLWNYCDSS